MKLRIGSIKPGSELLLFPNLCGLPEIVDSNLCSANTVRDYLEHRAEGKARELPFVYPSQIPVNDPKYHITTQKRPLAVYAKVGGQV